MSYSVVSQALLLDPYLVNRISDTRRIIAFRRRLIHAYVTIADAVVWGVLEANLPILPREVDALLREAEGQRC